MGYLFENSGSLDVDIIIGLMLSEHYQKAAKSVNSEGFFGLVSSSARASVLKRTNTRLLRSSEDGHF
ncbi:6268_t:CDS:2 [Cetraspora pellucida]|uniref:6268_t:CDS:1 n=1 Tax=Cetraspora pellucida TaxID=1433469 RepID=A0A9N9A7T7_9GLOM|nr:6268_t:CDS:2 [Cetraspora pellucida]